MKHRTHSPMLQHLLILLALLIQLPILAQNTYYAQDGGSFTETGIWKTSPLGKGDSPKTAEFTDGSATFVIQKAVTVLLNDKITIAALALSSGGTLQIAGGNMTVKGDVTINADVTTTVSSIHFADANALCTITGNLKGNENSRITHNATGKFRNELVLNGTTNSLDIFTNKATGTSIVRYTGTKAQTVFNSDSYQDLYLEGTGIKTLYSLPKSMLEGTTVNNKFSITNCRLRLADYNFSFAGQQSNLSYTDGWVVTNGAGIYKNITAESTVTFPVGNASSMQAIRFSNIKAGTLAVAFSGFNAFNTENGSIADGMGVWYVTASAPTSAIVTLIQPVASPSTLVSTSKIALYNTAWRTQTTTYDNRNLEYSSNVVLTDKNINSIGMVTCPTFTLAATTLPEAETGSPYSQNVLVTGGTPTYSLTQVVSTPAGFTGSIDPYKGYIKLSNEKPGKDNYTLTFTVRDTLRCETDLKVFVNIKSLTTIWDGKNWSNGWPTANMDAILQASYTIKNFDSIYAKNIRVEEKAVLTITNTNSARASGTLINNGAVVVECGSKLSYGALKGNDIKDYNPVFAPASLDPGITGQDYIAYFTANDSPENLNIDSIPNGFDFNKGSLLIKAPKPQLTAFTLTYSNNGCTVKKRYTVKIIDLPNPTLTIAPIGSKIVDGLPFKLTTTSKSKGDLTYSIASGSCAEIGKTGIVTIKCAGLVTVQVNQSATEFYRAASATQTFSILPATPKVLVRNFAFIVNENNSIKFISKSNDTTVLFDQVKGFSNATVNATGAVVPKSSGTFSVRISIPATANYLAFDSVYTFNVVSLQNPPVAMADTIVLATGTDTTFNILRNDMGMTEAITTDQTDIDMENKGVQTKYYSTELGTFTIDAEGNLTVRPFFGFIGSNRIGYTVTDANGLTSDMAYIYVTVKPPFAIPELKANEVMTPNNDKQNDALVIGNTDLNKENSITIMDGGGNTVYEKINYQNDWEGVDKHDKALEAGVYFYVFKEINSGRQLSNYIQIIKQ